jgi:putative membrane protein insertion efficiency factor
MQPPSRPAPPQSTMANFHSYQCAVATLVLLGLSHITLTDAACQACLFSVPLAARDHRHHVRALHTVPARQPAATLPLISTMCMLASRQYFGRPGWLRVQESSESAETDGEKTERGELQRGETSTSEQEESIVSGAAIGAIRLYKFYISPFLPPACRFVPTCSEYGVQAIREFGVNKGCILIAWRLLRCSPIGGRGYDPPRWPPVPYNYASY